MNCEHATRVLDAGLDGELDPATFAELSAHVAGCPTCAASRVDRESLREALRLAPRHAAPVRLRRAIQASLAGQRRSTSAGPGHGTSWVRASALAAVAVSAAFAMGWWMAKPPSILDQRDELVALHVGSLASGGRRYDVASSDRHVVKPWFAGKVDFAPPVPELQGSGFALVGARLDRVAGRPAAVIVYRIRQHDVALFVSRSAALTTEPMAISNARGFSMASWAEDGLTLTAISDVGPQELARFSALVRAPAR